MGKSVTQIEVLHTFKLIFTLYWVNATQTSWVLVTPAQIFLQICMYLSDFSSLSVNNKRFYRTFILFKNIHILQIQFNTHTNRAEQFEMSIIIKVHTVSIKIFRLLPRALMSPVFDITLFHFVQFFIYLLFLSIICCLLHISWCWSYYVGSNHNSGNSHAPNVFCKLDDL